MELIRERQSVWERAATAGKPVVLYGMGDAAARVLALLGERGIPVAGIFASDTFCRGQNFRGYPVERLADLEARLGDFLVLICFGVDYDEMLPYYTGNESMTVESFNTVPSKYKSFVSTMRLLDVTSVKLDLTSSLLKSTNGSSRYVL